MTFGADFSEQRRSPPLDGTRRRSPRFEPQQHPLSGLAERFSGLGLYPPTTEKWFEAHSCLAQVVQRFACRENHATDQAKGEGVGPVVSGRCRHHNRRRRTAHNG
jgi:hypothetical protein